MIHKTKWKLTALNAGVIFLILLISGLFLYFFVQQKIIGQIDHSLENETKQIESKLKHPGIRIYPKGGTIDLRIYLFVWDQENKLIYQDSKNKMVDINVRMFIKQFIPSKQQKFDTIQVNNHYYRVLNLSPSAFPTIGGEVKLIQLVRNMDAEQVFLETLLQVIGIGILLAVIATITAGYFLAGRALVPIRKSWEKQQEFIADASHELRTPLATIQLNTELLLRYPSSTIQQKSPEISRVLKETRRMSKLVTDLLTLARTDSSQVQIQKVNLTVDKVAMEVLEMFKPIASIKGITFTFDMESDLQWVGDEERFRQLLVILLDNAVKYNVPQGSIFLSCKKNKNKIEIVIKDTGIGIHEDDAPSIFDRFYRGDKARSHGGTGLGLSIAKWIVDTHHGRIFLDQTYRNGTCIIVSMPFK
ncbi:sensor histidine kinase [Shimazuella kribbensis]|uniref:sensor histidine kinase n=1 Tax=Shimazuella kribbensis TaxID=139808 RepID=UPI00048CC4A7|nr:HAMP domain-containing sensor histidine kinase [Shimazuella kribbensis]